MCPTPFFPLLRLQVWLGVWQVDGARLSLRRQKDRQATASS